MRLLLPKLRAGLLFAISLLPVLASCTKAPSLQQAANASARFDGRIIVYKTPECGCCRGYVDYLKKEGYKVEAINVKDLNSINNRYKIPAAMEACHTSVLGDYVVVGHVPVEAIQKLMNERPAIKGIALPGMPLDAPGMGGSGKEEFKIYALSAGEPALFIVTK